MPSLRLQDDPDDYDEDEDDDFDEDDEDADEDADEDDEEEETWQVEEQGARPKLRALLDFRARTA